MRPRAPAPRLDEFRTPRPIAGWRVVATAFWMAVFAWGLGFYSLSLYVHRLGEAGWSGTLLSAATTGYFLLGAAAIQGVERAAARFGRRRVALAGVLLLAGGVAALPRAGHPALLLAAYATMALGWAATSGTAISHVIGQWFEQRRGLALNLALTGASASGFLVIPPMAWAVAHWGVADGLAGVAAVLAVATLAAVAWNLPEPTGRGAVGAQVSQGPSGTPGTSGTSGTSAATAAALATEPLARVTALFAIGWLAQVAFLSQQMPLLVPKVGVAAATAAVAATTAASLVGRLLLSTVIDRVDHRLATAASYAVQAVGMVLLLASDAPAAVLVGCCLFGLSVGNVITLPAIFAQREFAPARYGAVVNRVWTVGQTLFALGPIGAGALLAATGTPAWTIAACLVMQLAAAALCAGPRHRA
ncbi:MAG: MFS transporter [Burkholderiales bacterium]|nr:MFS transporter [Burkholderiales bacterium]